MRWAVAFLGVLLAVIAAPGAGATELDPAFGIGGASEVDHAFRRSIHNTGFNDVTTTESGKVVAVGTTFRDAGSKGQLVLTITQFHEDGTLDEEFGEGGEVHVSSPDSKGNIKGFAVDLDGSGRIVVLGRSTKSFSFQSNTIVARVLPDGTLDRSFAGDGVRVLPKRAGQIAGYGLAVERTGGIVVAGAKEGVVLKDYGAALFRLRPSGASDRRFNRGPKGEWENFHKLLPGDYESASLSRALIGPDGIYLAGWALKKRSDRVDTVVAKLAGNGDLDPSFGSGGFSTFGFDRRGQSFPGSLAFDRNGRLFVFGGWRGKDSATIPGVASIRRNGELSPNFGTGGIATLLPQGTEDTYFSSGVVDDSGRLVFVAYDDDRVASEASFIGRLTPDGERDQSFGADGIYWIPEAPFIYPYATALDSQQRLLAVGGMGELAVVSRFLLDD